ncbi:unnamed protein product, partial [Rotaria sp. Silwood1]
ITWGPFKNEFKNFYSYGLFEKGKIKNAINLQDRFSDWYNKTASITHPVRESREKQTSWSLQDAIKIAFQQFLDKNETVNKWRCGLDFKLNTWKRKLFSKNDYNANEEKEKRITMIQYAVADCTAVTKLYFMIYPANSSIRTSYETPTTASTNITLNIDDLSDISENEEPQILMPRFDKEPEILMPRFDKEPRILMPYFDKPPQILIPKFDEQNYLTIETTEEEINEFNAQEQQQVPEQTTKTKLSKSEKQKQKNEKLKLKQKYHPNFQRKIKRPIYYRYDYRKIRAQLVEDQIYTSHQLTINRKKSEVSIGFKSAYQEEVARTKMKINYFSREQYKKRWGQIQINHQITCLLFQELMQVVLFKQHINSLLIYDNNTLLIIDSHTGDLIN